MCGGQMRLIAFITNGAEVRKILEHIGVDCEPPQGVQIEPGWDLAAQPAPDYEVDQRINW